MMMMMMTSESDDRFASDSTTPSPHPADTTRPPNTPPPATSTTPTKARPKPRPVEVLPPDRASHIPPESATTSRNQPTRHHHYSDAGNAATTDPDVDWHPSHTILSDEQWQRVADRFGLPPREVDVIKQFFDGRTERAAAYDLGIQRRTVHDYAKRIYRRLGVHDHAELIQRIWEEVECMKSHDAGPPPPDAPPEPDPLPDRDAEPATDASPPDDVDDVPS